MSESWRESLREGAVEVTRKLCKPGDKSLGTLRPDDKEMPVDVEQKGKVLKFCFHISAV